MDIESNSESKDSMDSVAQALMNIFSNDESAEDHSLSLFLAKIYKNNISSKPKRMNSIRLSRFNAFLYRLNSNYPHSPLANTIVHTSLVAVISNDKNFLEEEDEETVISIGRWACQILLRSLERGFYEPTFNLMKYLVNGQRPQIDELVGYEQLIKSEPYFADFELSCDDEMAAREPGFYSITSNFSLRDYVLSQLKIKEIYQQLFHNGAAKREIVKLFSKHVHKIITAQRPSEIFMQVFLSKPLSTTEEIAAILEALGENYFNNQAIVKALQLLVKKQEDVSIYFGLIFTDSLVQNYFLQTLKDFWKKRAIDLLVEPFLVASRLSNLAILYLILNSESPIPKKHLGLLFDQSQLKYQHTLVFAMTLAQYNDKKLSAQLIDLYCKHQSNLTIEQKNLIFKAIHYSISSQDKNLLYSSLINQVSIAQLGGPASLDFLPLADLKSDKITTDDKKRLLRILQSHQDNSESLLKIRAELLGICNHASSQTKKIKQLNAILQKPYEDMLRYIVQNSKRDPELIATLLMVINNKLYLTFIPEPRPDILDDLVSMYIDLHQSFGKSIARLENEERNSKKSVYYAALFRYGLHSKQKIGTLSGQIGELISGACNYRRVNGTDIADYLIREQEKKDLVSELWTGKKVVFQLRKLLQNVVNFNAAGSQQKRELKGLFDNEWAYPLAFEIIRTYFQAEMHDPSVLKELLATFQPTYDFFEQVERIYSAQLDEYSDVLYYTPEMLKEIYPEMVVFLSQLAESQSVKKEVKDKEKEKDKKKISKKKKNDKEKSDKKLIQETAKSDYIFDNNALFQTIMKRKQLNSLFGDAASLFTFTPLLKIIAKISDQFNRLERIANEWFPTIKIFHCQKIEQFDDWVSKVVSYCELWNVFLVQKKFKFQVRELQRHFHILTEFLNNLYESRKQLPEVEEKILLTLLLIYQASSVNKPVDVPQVPTEALKNFFLGYRLSTPNDQHYYHCFTCNLPICQICMPFLHKHHDVNYLGKDGHCVHDSNQKKKGEKEEEKRDGDRLLREGERLQKQMDRYQNLGGNNGNIFQPSSYSQVGLRNPRREDDWLMNTFEFPDEEVDYGQHLRFKQIMELRLRQQRDREKQREKELLFSREKDRIEKDRQEILEMFEKEKTNEMAEEKLQIRSCSSKSIKNLHMCQRNLQYFTPEFTPVTEPQTQYSSAIDTKPLRYILLREMQAQGNEECEKDDRGKAVALYQGERYNFFNKSNYFKGNNRPQLGMMRGFGMGIVNVAKKNLLTSNNKFLVYPSPNNGVILLSLANIVAKMNKRIQTRSFADFEQERGYLAGNINNSNFSFEPFQILFNRNSPNIMAIIGLTQIGFALLTNDGKLQKYSDSDFKSTEPILKFSWLSKHKNIFAAATGTNIRLGHVSDDGRVKTTNRFRVYIDKPIRDFEINNQGGNLFVYVIDNEGGLYRAEFDYRGAKALNITDKRLTYSENLEQLQSLIFADKKLLLASSSGKYYLLSIANKNTLPVFLQSYDLESALKANENTKNIKHPSYLSQLQLIQSSESLFSVGGILKRAVADPKRKGGYLFVVRINSKNNLEMILLYEQQSIESFEVTELGENSFLITAVDDTGTVFCFHYQIPVQLFNMREDTKIPVDDNSIRLCNKIIKTNSLLSLAKYCQPKRYDNFKENKDITNHYKIAIQHPVAIKISTVDPFKYFWTGISFTVEPFPPSSNISFDLFGRSYNFTVTNTRQIQIGFNIKQTIEIFSSDGEFSLSFKNNNAREIKNCRLYGMDFATESLYRRAYVHLHKIVIIHLDFSSNSLEQYLENADRHSFTTLDLSKFSDLKSSNKYTSKELNLLMKLELLRESIEQTLKTENRLEQSLDIVRTYLLPQCEKRQYLEKSCWKLIRRICQLGLPESLGITGHPLEYRTVLDFYYFEMCFSQWSSTHQLNHFQQLVNLLYALIFKRVGNLYIIFKIYPDLIYELTYFYKNLLQSMKFSKNEAKDQSQLQKLINICPNFVALICEYYQTLKNSSKKMIEQENEQEQSPENMILSLLQEVFCATRKELYREVFISPEVYLQKLYLSPKESHPLSSAISIFDIEDRRPDAYQPIKKNCIDDADNEKSEDYLQLEEQSEKEVVLQEQAREMIEVSSEYQEFSNQMLPEKLSNQQKFKRIHDILKGNLLPSGTQISFIYYQFSFQMATALFTLTHYINEQNAVFYIGFLFNLLRIIEMNLEPRRDVVYLNQFFTAVFTKIYSEKHSVLFMVLNYFFEPVYSPKTNGERQISQSQSKLSRQFSKFLENEKIVIEDLFLHFNITKTDKTVSFGEAMKFNSFAIENHLYQLKFLGNLYFNVTLQNIFYPVRSDSFKYKILGGVVKYKLRILENIMQFEGWQNDLEEARVEVGFETLQTKAVEGISILSSCSKAQPAIFIKKLNENPTKIKILEDQLEDKTIESIKIIEMLTIYYNS